MEVATIESRTLKIIEENLGMNAPPKLTDSFVADLGCDSLDLLEIVMALEDEFNIDVADDDATSCMTVAQVVALITRLRSS